jgi:release factor glutamine methyltransferase
MHIEDRFADGAMVRAATELRGVRRTSTRHVLRSMYRAALEIRLKIWLRTHSGTQIERFDGLTFIILPGVFNGVACRTGAFLASSLARLDIYPGDRVLDLGTGSGIIGLSAARRGAFVIATDINPEAVRCARVNALIGHLEGGIETRVGDLFEPVSGEKFDLVLFNPPYYRGAPRNLADAAWRSADVFDRFLRDLPSHLTDGGRALVVLSTDSDIHDEHWSARGLTVRVTREQDLINETLTVYEIAVAEERA